jgi:Lrp/AsnC family transcriptional regulator, leucine-responsive regulatory protein
MDRIDLRILEELQNDGRLSIVELSARVNLSKTPCAERVRRLERQGYILGYRAELNPTLLDAGHVLIVLVTLDKTVADALDRFKAAVRRIPEVQCCYMVAGNFDYMLKVRTKDIAHYRSLLENAIGELPNVQQTHSFVVMEPVKDEITVPVGVNN